ncbi:uncharacterized protein LOC118227921 isoform X2 [Anguilla anguilla]|uniref:uncharacterized protein LOC118227921 isoform X2 n=1 Tax=Anguilla anguilla TaxID=7936 RepID=UPI0015AE0AB1|nr:uncharacterized protein LOC118227921 isoform X2 [Anguilla anguilla]
MRGLERLACIETHLWLHQEDEHYIPAGWPGIHSLCLRRGSHPPQPTPKLSTVSGGAHRQTAPMQQDGSEKHALLCTYTDQDHDRQDDDRPGDPVLNRDHKRRTWPPCRWACPCSLALALGVLQVFCVILYVETHWTVEDLQRQISTLNKKAECHYMNGKNPEDGVKDNTEHVQGNLLTQQKLLTVESNIARVNQYVVALKTRYENLKSEVQVASHTQLESLSDAILRLNETTMADTRAVRAELSRLKCLFANVTRWMCGLEERLSSHVQNFSFPALELIEDEICNFTAFADQLDSRVSKPHQRRIHFTVSEAAAAAFVVLQGHDGPFADVPKPGARMGLVHGHPNGSDLRTTHAPLPRPRLQENNSSTDILLMKIKSQPTTNDTYSDISVERGNSSAVTSVPEEGASKELDREEGNARPTADGKKTPGLRESEMD